MIMFCLNFEVKILKENNMYKYTIQIKYLTNQFDFTGFSQFLRGGCFNNN